jgi:hypothetical protein
MRKIFFTIIGLFLLNACSSSLNKNSKQPKWLSDSYRSMVFPSDQYYVKFDQKKLSDFPAKSEKEKKNEFSRDLETQLVRQIVDKISFSTSSSELQTDNKKIDYISSVLRESSQTASATLIGKHEDYYIDKSNKTISAIVYVKKADLAKGYRSTLNPKIDLLKNKIDQYLTTNLQDGKSILSEINSEIKTIQNDIEVYTIIISATDTNLIEKYNNMYSSYLKLNATLGNDSKIIESLINEADQLYQKESNFEIVIAKLNEALLYDSNNEKVLNKIKDYKLKWTLKLTSELNSKISNKEFVSAIKILDKLVLVDQNNEIVYREKQKNIIEDYFRETIINIKNLVKNGSLNEGLRQLSDISKYSYVDLDEYNNIKSQLEAISVDNAIGTIENHVYNKNYELAASVCKKNLILYPKNKKLRQLFEEVLTLVGENKKTELMKTRPTRYVLELNYSLSHSPEIILDKNNPNLPPLDVSKIKIINQLMNLELGLYKKINIKEKNINFSGNHKFSYSQIGVRLGYLDLSKQPFVNNFISPSTTFYYNQSKVTQIEASFIWRRFFMFNLGYLTETLPEVKSDLSIVSKENSYLCSTIGLRIPFDFIHLTADVSGYSNGNDTAKVFAKAGISINIGFSKKFNGEDKKYIENEVSLIRNN